jgi:hypothetical protein
VIQYRVYLLGELGKLRHVDASTSFIGAVGSSTLARLGLPDGPEDLAARFPDHGSVSAFVASLSDQSAVGIAESCDTGWRRNGVSAKLRLGSSWSNRERG